jgi:hypothetical protein
MPTLGPKFGRWWGTAGAESSAFSKIMALKVIHRQRLKLELLAVFEAESFAKAGHVIRRLHVRETAPRC